MRFRPRLLLLPISLFCLRPWLASGAAPDEEASLQFFRDLAETRNYTLGRPVAPKLTPDGSTVIFLRAGPRDPVLRLLELDLVTGRTRELLTPEQILGAADEQLSVEEKARRERARMSLKGFTTFDLSKDARHLLVTLSGKLYVVRRADLEVIELPGENWIDPRFSPDGTFVAAAQAGELHVIELATRTARPLTQGARHGLSHGTAEFVAQEEMDRSKGYWWSPDSKRLVYQQTDETDVEVRYIADPLRPEVEPQAFFYPRAGTANAKVRLGVVSREGGSTRWIEWDRERFPYLARVTWDEAAAPLTLLVQNRTQTEQLLLTADPATGATGTLLRETDSAWLNLDGHRDDLRPPLWLKDGQHFLWTTERGGSWQIELHDATGALMRTLTPLEWRYRALVGVDETAGTVFALGSDDPREVQLWSFPLTGGDGTALSAGQGQHTAAWFGRPRRFIRSSDLAGGDYRCDVIDPDGTVVASVPSVAEPMPRRAHTRFLRTEGARSFDAAVTVPHELAVRVKAAKPQTYPVILYVYAGPGFKRVTFSARDFLLDQWMADQGYIVVRIDGRGTPGHGREWERCIKGNFIDVALEDQIAGLRAIAAKMPEMDLSRVGVAGWSFGGYFSAMAAIRRPDLFKAGVAGAPVVTWENYDTHYTERYLGLPQDEPEAYRVSNVTTYAEQLERPLLIIHGLTDDNVYAQHSLQLCDALYRAGKHYEFMPMLGTHMISDPLIRLRQQARVMEFFERALK